MDNLSLADTAFHQFISSGLAASRWRFNLPTESLQQHAWTGRLGRNQGRRGTSSAVFRTQPSWSTGVCL